MVWVISGALAHRPEHVRVDGGVRDRPRVGAKQKGGWVAEEKVAAGSHDSGLRIAQRRVTEAHRAPIDSNLLYTVLIQIR